MKKLASILLLTSSTVYGSVTFHHGDKVKIKDNIEYEIYEFNRRPVGMIDKLSGKCPDENKRLYWVVFPGSMPNLDICESELDLVK